MKNSLEGFDIRGAGRDRFRGTNLSTCTVQRQSGGFILTTPPLVLGKSGNFEILRRVGSGFDLGGDPGIKSNVVTNCEFFFNPPIFGPKVGRFF